MTGARDPGRQVFWGQTVIAAALAAAFVIPYGAARLWGESRDMRWLTSGLTVAEMNEWRESGFTAPADAIRWRNARFKGPGAQLWIEEGWRDANEAARWRDAGFFAREARRWKDAGVDPAEAAIRRRNGRGPG